jgi:NADP-dependent 3-hydroxy acid dehydrogenase YdfG
VRIDGSTRALVTGASRGIGRALAEALAARGATVGLAARSQDEVGALAAELPGDHVPLPCDVSDRAAVERAVEAFVEEAGGLDLVVANAGIARYGPFRETGVDAVEAMTAVNWLGTVYTVGAALPHLLDQARGHIAIVSSGAGHRSFPWAAGYGATKAAQRMFGEALRHELSGTGVSLTMVYPGEVATALHAHEKDRMPDWYRGGPRAGSADELAEKVLEAVEADRRAVHFPPLVRLLGAVHGLSPRLADRMLRTLRGATAAPRRD